MKYYITLLFALISTIVDAQTFYYTSFENPEDDLTYEGLMIYYDDDNCTMRIINPKLERKNKVWEGNYVMRSFDKKKKGDVGLMIYACDEDEKDMPTFFWVWTKRDASDMPEVPHVLMSEEDDFEDAFEAEEFYEVSLKDMDEEFISRFYGEEEEEYEMMVEGMKKMQGYDWDDWDDDDDDECGYDEDDDDDEEDVADNDDDDDDDDDEDVADNDDDDPSTNSGQADTDDNAEDVTETTGGGNTLDKPDENVEAPTTDGTLHLVVVANTNVSDIGASCKTDMDNVRQEFTAVSKVTGLKYKEHLVHEKNYNKAYAVKTIRGLKVNKSDVVVFVYTGHGFRFNDQKEYYPCIDLTSSSYDDVTKAYASMTDIYNEITKKGARLNIVLSDCCNTLLGTTTPMVNVNTLFSRANKNFDVEKIKKLFLGSEGNIWATAASPGEASWCGPRGGFFLMSFIESFRAQTSALSKTEPSWNTIVDNAITSALKKSKTNAGCKAQNGLQKVQVKSVKR